MFAFSRNPETRWRTAMLVGFVSIIALFCVAWLFLLLVQFTGTSYSYATKATQSLANAYATLVENSTSDDLGSELAKAVSNDDYRILYLDSNLTVIADSENSATGDTWDASLPEIQGVIERGQSAVRRVPDNAGIEQIYVAQECSYRGSPGYLLVSTENRTMADTLTSTQAFGLGLLLSLLLLTSLISYIAYRFAADSVQMNAVIQAKFIANASHELKTPIAGIKLLSESINRSIQRGNFSRVQECAQKIDQDCDHLEGIVASLIEVARSQSSPTPMPPDLQYHLVDALEAVRQSFDKHRVLALGKHLDYQLEVSLPEDYRYLLKVPAPSSTAIADNLIENAINYTSAGFVHVLLSSTGNNILFSVSDSGPGMTKREQEMVFERHYRARRTQALNPQGTGLGLSMVKEAVAASNGSITLESEPDVGSTFTVMLPATKQKRNVASHQAK